jgi:hypothetical protein
MWQNAELEGKALLNRTEEETEGDIREKSAYVLEVSENLNRKNREEADAEAQALKQEAQSRMRNAVNLIVGEIHRLCQ